MSESVFLNIVSGGITAFLPNLEVFNWRGLFVYADLTPWKPFLWANVYAFVWVLLLISLSAAILSRRDLG